MTQSLRLSKWLPKHANAYMRCYLPFTRLPNVPSPKGFVGARWRLMVIIHSLFFPENVSDSNSPPSLLEVSKGEAREHIEIIVSRIIKIHAVAHRDLDPNSNECENVCTKTTAPAAGSRAIKCTLSTYGCNASKNQNGYITSFAGDSSCTALDRQEGYC